MHYLQKKLIGALIGLARATDGNEHLITPDATAVVIECLASVPEDDTYLKKLLGRVEDVKRKMVPNCFLCENPCGRTSDYNLDDLQNENAEIYRLKCEILENICTLAASGSLEFDPRILYNALIVIGLEDYNTEYLEPILSELKSLNAI